MTGERRRAAAAFGEELRAARATVNVSQGELATALGIDKGSISKMEAGLRAGPPPPDMVRRIAEALDVDPGPMLRAAGYEMDGRPFTEEELSGILDLLDEADERIGRLREDVRRRLRGLGREA